MTSGFCPHCEASFDLLEGEQEKTANCPQCQQSVEVASTNGTGNEAGTEQQTPDQIASPEPAEKNPEAETAQRPKPFFRRLFHKTNPMDVNVVLTGLIGAAVTTFLYLAIFPLMAGTYLGDLMTKRGWVQHAIIFLSTWSVAMLTEKYLNLARQTKAIKLDLLPRALSERITPGNAAQFSRHLLESDAQNNSNNLLVKRILRALQHLIARGQAKDVVDLLNGQNESDSNAVESSFTMLRLCVWAIPLLGFIGTVLGIGQAVGGLSGSIQAAVNLDAMKNSIGIVTTGLGIAFDTTLLGLVMSILIMFPTSSLQKSEEDFLSSVEDYCNEQLVGRLEDRKIESKEDHATSEETIQKAIALEMAKHREQLETTRKNLEESGRLTTENLATEWRKIQEQFTVLQAQHIEALTALNLKLAAQVSQGQREMSEGTIQAVRTVGEVVGKGQAQMIEQIQNQETHIKQINNWTQRIDEQRVEKIDFEMQMLEGFRKRLSGKRGFKDLMGDGDKQIKSDGQI